MKSELPAENQNKPFQSLDQHFANRPHLRERLLDIADMIDQAVAQGCTAHQAEARAIELIRKMSTMPLTPFLNRARF